MDEETEGRERLIRLPEVTQWFQILSNLGTSLLGFSHILSQILYESMTLGVFPAAIPSLGPLAVGVQGIANHINIPHKPETKCIANSAFQT